MMELVEKAVFLRKLVNGAGEVTRLPAGFKVKRRKGVPTHMTNHPNYRISVEIIILHNNKILLTKRADNAEVAPGVWNVPAGKVKYHEVPLEALFREAKEETNLDVTLIRELNVRTFKGKTANEDIYRLIFTYLVKPKSDDLTNFALNNEHSEFAWVDKEELMNEQFSTLHSDIVHIIQEKGMLT